MQTTRTQDAVHNAHPVHHQLLPADWQHLSVHANWQDLIYAVEMAKRVGSELHGCRHVLSATATASVVAWNVCLQEAAELFSTSDMEAHCYQVRKFRSPMAQAKLDIEFQR